MINFWQPIVRPISQRIGTAVGAALSSLGMAQDEASVITAAVPIILGFAFDLVIRRLY